MWTSSYSSRFIEMFGDTLKNEKQWAFKKLPEVTNIVLGSTPSSSNPDYWDGDVKWITPAEINEDSFVLHDSERHLTEAGVESTSLKPFPAGTVIFSTRAPIGKTAIAGCEMYCNQGFKNFVCSDAVNPVFLFYTLRIHKEVLQKMGTGSTFLELSKKTIEQISITVPPRVMQDEFESIYRQADKSKFTGFKSRFIEMFGNPNSNPRCLPTGLVSDYFTLQMGKTPARDTARYWAKDGSGNKWISIADMSHYEYFTNDTEEYISESAIQETGMKLIPKNTVIMSFKLTIGRVSVTSEPIYSNEAIVAFIPKTQDYSTRFLYYLVKYYDWLENAALAVKGKTLNKESIGKNRLIIPSRESQNEFATFAEQADKSKYLN